MAKYIIEDKEHILEFESDPIGFFTCMRIKRIAEANKKWKGYSLFKMDFSTMGLKTLHIVKV